MLSADLYMLSTDEGVSRASLPGSCWRSRVMYAECDSGATMQMKRVLFLANSDSPAAVPLSVSTRKRSFHVLPTPVGRAKT